MSVSTDTVDTVFAQLQNQKNGATFVELSVLTRLSIPTVRQAVSVLRHSGRITQAHSRPVVFKAVQSAPKAGQTLIVREPMPPIEINPQLVATITDAVKLGQKSGDEMADLVVGRIAANSHEKNKALLVFLVNAAEVIRVRLENDSELSVDDVMGESK